MTFAVLVGSILSVLGVSPSLSASDFTETGPSALEPAKAVVHLYFAAADHSFLMAEERVLDRNSDPSEFAKAIVNALIEGPQQNLMRTVPKETVLRTVYIADDGIAYVDFTDSIRVHHPGGCRLEQLSIYAIVNSLILNMDRIQTVKILIDGQEAFTLAGHIDLRFPFSADMLIIR